MMCDNNDITEFHLIEDRYSTWWHEYAPHPFDGRMAYLNFAGSGFHPTGKEKVLQRVQAESFEDLDWAITSMVQPNSEYGWLDRDGHFHGCGFQAHDQYARYMLRRTVWELEETGWIRIHGKGGDLGWSFGLRFSLRLSPEQRAWLVQHDYKVDEDD